MIKRSVRPCSEGFDFHRPLNHGSVCALAGPHQGLHRGSPPSESGGSGNARFYWFFRTSEAAGGEGGILSNSPEFSRRSARSRWRQRPKRSYIEKTVISRAKPPDFPADRRRLFSRDCRQKVVKDHLGVLHRGAPPCKCTGSRSACF